MNEGFPEKKNKRQLFARTAVTTRRPEWDTIDGQKHICSVASWPDPLKTGKDGAREHLRTTRSKVQRKKSSRRARPGLFRGAETQKTPGDQARIGIT